MEVRKGTNFLNFFHFESIRKPIVYNNVQTMQLKAVIFNKILSMKNHVIEMVRMTGGRESTERVSLLSG